jgi:hypothetical protein
MDSILDAKLKKIVVQEKQKSSVWKCRCADYICECDRFNDRFGKELCEDITKKLSEKFGFNYDEAIALLFS